MLFDQTLPLAISLATLTVVVGSAAVELASPTPGGEPPPQPATTSVTTDAIANSSVAAGRRRRLGNGIIRAGS